MESSLSSASEIRTRQRKHQPMRLQEESPPQKTLNQTPEPGRYKSSPVFAAQRQKSLHGFTICALGILVVAAVFVVLMYTSKSSISTFNNNHIHIPLPPSASPITTRNAKSNPTSIQTQKPKDVVGATDDAFSITNINAPRVYPLESLGIQSATEFFQRGMRQRSKPFSLTHFDLDITCQTPGRIGDGEEWKTRAPYVLILGAQKGGTTAMAYYLYNHPRFIYLPSKELHFFDDDMDAWPVLTNLNGTDILDRYHSESISQDYNMTIFRQQQQINPAYIMDATPNYLFESDRVPQRVFCACGGWVKLLAFLRNPVDRAWSQYHMQHNFDTFGNLTNLPSFEEYIEMDLKVLKEVGVLPPENEGHAHYGSAEEAKAWKVYTRLGINSPLGRGLYSIQLRQWFNTMNDFGKPSSDLMVFSSEQMKVHSKVIYHQVLDFLELQHYEMSNFESVHKTRYDDSVKLKTETRKRLQDFFRPYNQQLKDLLGSEWEGIWEETE